MFSDAILISSLQDLPGNGSVFRLPHHCPEPQNETTGTYRRLLLLQFEFPTHRSCHKVGYCEVKCLIMDSLCSVDPEQQQKGMVSLLICTLRNVTNVHTYVGAVACPRSKNLACGAPWALKTSSCLMHTEFWSGQVIVYSSPRLAKC